MGRFIVHCHTETKEWGVYDLNGSLILPVFRHLANMKRLGYSPNTLKGYAEDLRDLYVFMEDKGLTFPELRSRHIQDFNVWEYQPKEERGSNQIYLGKTPSIGEATWNRRVSAINSFMDWHETNDIPLKLKRLGNQKRKGKQYGYQRKTSTWNVKTWEKAPEYITLIQREQIRNILNPRNRLIFDLFYFSGLRISELFSLTIDSIPAVENSSIVPVRLEDNRTRDKLKGRTKTGSRLFYIPFGLYASLRHYMKPLQRRGEAGRGKKIRHRFLFTTIRNGGKTKKGDPLSQSTFRKSLRDACIKANVFTIRNEKKRHFVPHDLRHTFATDILRATKDIKLVQEVLGHQSIVTTQKYTHISDEEIASSLGDVFDELYTDMFKGY